MSEVIKYGLDYYYGKESEQFSFYRIPKLLFTDERFKSISSDAKVLYGLMLDRMSLSIKNGWLDAENRAYIYFTLEEAMGVLSIGKDKGIKLFAELDDKNGCGLIKKKRQGLGKPTMIFVMNFNSVKCLDNGENGEVNGDFKTSEKPTSEGKDNTEVRSSEKPKSGIPKNRNLDFGNTEVNKTEINNNKNNHTEASDNNPIISDHSHGSKRKSDVIDEIETRNKYKAMISKNIEFEYISEKYGRSNADGILEIMLDAVCSKRDYQVVSGCEIPSEVVKSRLLKLNCCHIEYVFDCLRSNTTKIHNIKSYILTALYNSFSTMDHFYIAEVNHDMYGNI